MKKAEIDEYIGCLLPFGPECYVLPFVVLSTKD
jgi:hypothetical protein